MKKLLPLFLLLFCLQTAYGQKIRFTDTSNVWTVFGVGDNFPWGKNTIYLYRGDTIVNGYHYLQLRYDGLIREDTATGIVYIKYFQSDSNEIVLYDYNLAVGDSFKSKLGIHVVNKIDSTLIQNVWHRVWQMDEVGGYRDYSIIEGIGTTRGPLFSVYPDLFEKNINLICFNNSGSIITVPDSSGGYYLSPATCLLSVNKVLRKNETVSVSPNPANENSKIVFPYNIQSGSLYITNMLGQVVMQRSIVNSEQVYIGSGISAEGVYFYKVMDNQTGNNFTGRFVYQ